MPEFFGDTRFWLGLGVFVISLWGALRILRALGREPDLDDMEMRDFEVESAKDLPRIVSGEERSLASSAAAAPAEVTLQSLSERLNRMEEVLAKIEKKLGESGKTGDLSDEVQGLLQFLKSNPSASNNQVSQLSAKVDKIYQVIGSLSGTEGKT